MNLAQLEKRIDRSIDLTVETWAKAALLGEARRLSNVRRGQAADRGMAGNRAVDLHGALGELVLLTIAERARSLVAVAQMTSHLFKPNGGRGVSGPDLVVTGALHNSEDGVDAKTFDCHPNKRYFAINDDKHASLRGYCLWYFALIAPPFGRRAELARLVPYADVEGWPVSNLRAGGNPSRNLPITKFLWQYCSRPIDLARLRRETYDPSAVERFANEKMLRTDLFNLIPGTERYLQQHHVQIRADARRGTMIS